MKYPGSILLQYRNQAKVISNYLNDNTTVDCMKSSCFLQFSFPHSFIVHLKGSPSGCFEGVLQWYYIIFQEKCIQISRELLCEFLFRNSISYTEINKSLLIMCRSNQVVVSFFICFHFHSSLCHWDSLLSVTCCLLVFLCLPLCFNAKWRVLDNLQDVTSLHHF